MRVQMVDPPAVWRYGFPKLYVPGNENSLDEWLLANGSPQHEVDQQLTRVASPHSNRSSVST